MIWAQLYLYMGVSQVEIADKWKVRQQTVSGAIQRVRAYYNNKVPVAARMTGERASMDKFGSRFGLDQVISPDATWDVKVLDIDESDLIPVLELNVKIQIEGNRD